MTPLNSAGLVTRSTPRGVLRMLFLEGSHMTPPKLFRGFTHDPPKLFLEYEIRILQAKKTPASHAGIPIIEKEKLALGYFRATAELHQGASEAIVLFFCACPGSNRVPAGSAWQLVWESSRAVCPRHGCG